MVISVERLANDLRNGSAEAAPHHLLFHYNPDRFDLTRIVMKKMPLNWCLFRNDGDTGINSGDGSRPGICYLGIYT